MLPSAQISEGDRGAGPHAEVSHVTTGVVSAAASLTVPPSPCGSSVRSTRPPQAERARATRSAKRVRFILFVR
jgi:hypothetical protein